MRRREHEEVRVPQHRVQLGAVEEPVDLRQGPIRSAHSGHTHLHPLTVARDLTADTAEAHDRERLIGQLFAAVALPPLRVLVALHQGVVLREHEHRHQTEIGERPRVNTARRRKRDVGAVEPEPQHELADARAGRL